MEKQKRYVRDMKCKKKDKFLYLKIFIKSFFDQIVRVPEAVVYYRFFLKKRDNFDIIICPHIGDFLYTLGYVNEFIKEKEIKNVRIICIEKFEALFRCYAGLQFEYYGVNEKELQLLLIANRYHIGQYLFSEMKNNIVVEPANAFVLGNDYIKRYPDFNLKLCIKYGSFQLAKDSTFDKPLVYKVDEKNKSKKQILICSFAQSIEQKEVGSMLQMLVVRLLDQGYEILINGFDKQFQAYHVTFVDWELDKMYRNCIYLYSVIGIRSGILDLAAFSGTKVIAIYPEKYELVDFYDLEAMVNRNGNIFQYVMSGNIDQDVEKVLHLNEI